MTGNSRHPQHPERERGATTTTPFFDGALTIVQPASGYRFSVDSLLLARFVLSGGTAREPFVDLGAGCGVISALLAAGGLATGLVVELQEELHAAAAETLAANTACSRLKCVRADLRELGGVVEPGSHPTVVSNPPYFELGAGRVPPDRAAATARHELACTMEDVLSAARFILPPGGRCFLVYPVARLPRLMELMPRHKLHPVRVQFVHPTNDRDASHFLMEGAKSEGPELTVSRPLVTHVDGGGYGDWFEELKRLCGC